METSLCYENFWNKNKKKDKFKVLTPRVNLLIAPSTCSGSGIHLLLLLDGLLQSKHALFHFGDYELDLT
jgi:hypothetical protein